MQHFDGIHGLAADRHGGIDALEQKLARPKPTDEPPGCPMTAGCRS